jgi:hypothetical protein
MVPDRRTSLATSRCCTGQTWTDISAAARSLTTRRGRLPCSPSSSLVMMGIRFMPQMGHEPGPGCRTCGCIEQVHSTPSPVTSVPSAERMPSSPSACGALMRLNSVEPRNRPTRSTTPYGANWRNRAGAACQRRRSAARMTWSISLMRCIIAHPPSRGWRRRARRFPVRRRAHRYRRRRVRPVRRPRARSGPSPRRGALPARPRGRGP